MPWWAWTLIAVYAVGFCGTFWLIATHLENYTLGLVLFCSFLWPIWWGSRGRFPYGEPQQGPD